MRQLSLSMGKRSGKKVEDETRAACRVQVEDGL